MDHGRGAVAGLPAWALGFSLGAHAAMFAVLPGPAAYSPPVPLQVSLPRPQPVAEDTPAPPVLATAPAAPQAKPRTPRVVPAEVARQVVAAAPTSGERTAGKEPVAVAAPPPATAREPAAAVPPPAAPVAPAPALARALGGGEALAEPVEAALARYARRLAELLAHQQQYPRLAALRGWEGEVRLRLRVARKGAIVSVEVLQSSGFELLDRHARQLVEAAPLPDLPEVLQERDFYIVVPVQYKLEKTT